MRRRLVHVVTVPITASTLMRGQLAHVQRHFDVTVVSSPGPELEEVRERENVDTIAVPMLREPSPLHDARSLVAVASALRRVVPDIVVSSTPKAGLLGSLAAFRLRVPARVYFVRGLRLETTAGVLRRVLGATERAAAASATHVFCNSTSLRDRFVDLGLARAAKVRVLGAGSSNGVDVDRFERTDSRARSGLAIRARLGIDPSAIVIGFIGRLVEDKGIRELASAFERIANANTNVHLLLVGGDFAGDNMSSSSSERLRGMARAHVVGKVADPESWYAAMDVLAFPSYREGFPNAPLEAAAGGLPVVGFRTTGVVDAVEDGVTGTLVPLHDERAFGVALERYVRDADLRRHHGTAGRARVVRSFDRRIVWDAWVKILHDLV